MTKQEAIEHLTAYRDMWKVNTLTRGCTESVGWVTVEALDMAIEALTELDNNSTKVDNENVDLISRQDAIDAINHICPVDTEYDCTLLDRVDVRCVLSDLPSAQPDLSGYSDRLWKRAYDRGYERCRQDAIDAMRQSVCGDTWEVDKAIEAVEKLPSVQQEKSTVEEKSQLREEKSTKKRR